MDQRRDVTDVGGMSDTSNMRSTTAITPQQMRDRADENAEWAQTAFGLPGREQDARELLLNADMFRTAADQLEAVQQYVADGEVEDDRGQHVVYTYGLKRILTADTAPQEGRDD